MWAIVGIANDDAGVDWYMHADATDRRCRRITAVTCHVEALDLSSLTGDGQTEPTSEGDGQT